nr:MAG TPA: hypothetical protein [Caudoviricetes sp.]
MDISECQGQSLVECPAGECPRRKWRSQRKRLGFIFLRELVV